MASATPDKERSRRAFLKTAAAAAIGVGLGATIPPIFALITGQGPPAEPEREIDPLVFEDVPLAVQLDLPEGYSPLVTDGSLFLGDISRDAQVAEQVAVENNLYPTVSTVTKVPPGQIMLLPEGIAPRGVDRTLLTITLKASLQPRLARNHNLSDSEDFTVREQALFGREIPIIMKFLARTLPVSATRGVVLIRRPDDEFLEKFTATGGSAEDVNGFFHTGFYASVHPDAVSFRRDIDAGGVMKSGKDQGGAVLSRIYFTRQPSDDLRAKLAAELSFNPLDREWQQYFLRGKKVFAHELAHLAIIDDINISPFDPHRIIAAVGIGAVLEGLSQRGEWEQGSLKSEPWSDPYLQLMRYDRSVYKELFEALGVNESPFPRAFSEWQVRDAFTDIVSQHPELSNIGTAAEILHAIENSPTTGYKYNDDDIWQV